MGTRELPVKRETVIVTPEARKALSRQDIKTAACKNAACDWGNIGEDEWSRNDKAYKTGGKTVAQYISAKGKEFLFITESDGAAPRVLLPGAGLKRAC